MAVALHPTAQTIKNREPNKSKIHNNKTMDQNLREALRVITPYHNKYWYTDELSLPYYTSADALLEVWRAVNTDCIQNAGWLLKDLSDVYYLIAYDNLPKACIELAAIIKQVSKKK